MLAIYPMQTATSPGEPPQSCQHRTMRQALTCRKLQLLGSWSSEVTEAEGCRAAVG